MPRKYHFKIAQIVVEHLFPHINIPRKDFNFSSDNDISHNVEYFSKCELLSKTLMSKLAQHYKTDNKRMCLPFPCLHSPKVYYGVTKVFLGITRGD